MTLNERAARVMGYPDVVPLPDRPVVWIAELGREWDPEHSIADAWRLVERMRELGWTWFSVGRDIDCERWVAYFDKPGGPQIIAGDDESAPAAITHAACKAWEESSG